jgi:hypothetical protein
MLAIPRKILGIGREALFRIPFRCATQEFFSMFDRSAQLELLLDLESRQDDLMLRLDELDHRVEKTLAECLSLRTLEAQPNTRSEAA